ncbi:MAG: DUF86 domain-containing protein [Micrococcales bacterium]|nr:DUF86 domain-containing protein [Micrococcales bacterium]
MQRDRLYVVDMIRVCTRIIELTTDRDTAAIELDAASHEALLWNFTVLGEASAQISEETRAAHPQVPWRRAASMRNRIIHGYWSADTDILVTTAHEVIPGMLTLLPEVLADLPE